MSENKESSTVLTNDEKVDFIQLKNKTGELTHKEKLRLAVYYNLIKKSNGINTESVSSREASDLGKTENDYYKKEGDKVFKTVDNDAKNNCKYEYTTDERVNTAAGDAAFKRKIKMKLIVKDTICRCETAENILNKRALTAEEEQEIKALKLKRDNNRADYDDDVRFEELKNIRIAANEREIAKFIQGVTKCYYYKNAHNVLLPGSSYREWNKDITKSAESADILSTCPNAKHVSIGVYYQDPIDYAAKLKVAPLNRNPVVIIDANRMGPGGAWERGEEGIEEQVFLRTTASLALDREMSDHFYPLKNEAVLYVPKAMIFRKNRSADYKVLEDNKNPDFQSLIFASGAIVKQTQISGDDVTEELNEITDTEIYVNKIKNCMATALFNGHDSIVFTAIGCYNYGKKFDDCADAFLYAIFDPVSLYYRRFKSIVICVPPDILPPLIETYEVVEASSKKTMQKITDMNALLCQTLTTKLHKITVQDIMFSSLSIHNQIGVKKGLNDAFAGLKL